MTDQAKPVLRPWRRFLRLSVRGMIVVVLVIGVWLGWVVHSARMQRDAVAAIRDAGGAVYYDWEWQSGEFVRGGKPWAPRRIVRLFGVDYFGHVCHVSFRDSASDRPLPKIEELQRPLDRLEVRSGDQSVFYIGCTLGNMADMASKPSRPLLPLLVGLTRLDSLELCFNDLSDEPLAYLERLTSLSQLDLSITRFTDAGLFHLKRLTNLKHLDLSGTHVTDAGVNGLLQALPRLQVTR